jgi:hypothetical protein
MLAERIHHAIGRTVTFEAPASWPVPRIEPSGAHLRFPIAKTQGSFEVRVSPFGVHSPEQYLDLHATAVRRRHGVPILDLVVDDRADEHGIRRLAVEFDIASYVWRSVLFVGAVEWVHATAVVPRARAEELFMRFEGLLRCIAIADPVAVA